MGTLIVLMPHVFASNIGTVLNLRTRVLRPLLVTLDLLKITPHACRS